MKLLERVGMSCYNADEMLCCMSLQYGDKRGKIVSLYLRISCPTRI